MNTFNPITILFWALPIVLLASLIEALVLSWKTPGSYDWKAAAVAHRALDGHHGLLHAAGVAGLPAQCGARHAGYQPALPVLDSRDLDPQTWLAPCVYGLVKPVTNYNPLGVEFGPWAALFKDIVGARTVGEAIGYLWRPPGWRPDASSQTTDDMRARSMLA